MKDLVDPWTPSTHEILPSQDNNLWAKRTQVWTRLVQRRVSDQTTPGSLITDVPPRPVSPDDDDCFFYYKK